MAAINFPPPPVNVGEEYTQNGKTWIWTGLVWKVVPTSSGGSEEVDWDDIQNKPAFGSASLHDYTSFATAAQGALANTALQPEDIPEEVTTFEFPHEYTGDKTIDLSHLEISILSIVQVLLFGIHATPELDYTFDSDTKILTLLEGYDPAVGNILMITATA